MVKTAIATLVRRNDIINKWENNFIILRNKSIKKYLENTNVDLIIFHEKDFSEEYKKFIGESCTDDLGDKIKFIEVPNFKLTDEEFKIIKTKADDPRVITTGYASMCKFWAYGFLEYTKDYDKLIRIDDDCIVLSNIDIIFENLKNKFLVFPYMSGEDCRKNQMEYINKFFLELHPIKNFKPIIDKRIEVPYTNFCGFNLQKIRKNKHFFYFFKWLEENNLIYLHTWQDAALWGILMKHLLDENDWMEMNSAKYIHLSHLSFVN